MRTLLLGALLAVSFLGTEASAQTEQTFTLDEQPRINFDVTVHPRARFRFELKVPTYEGVERYRLPPQQQAYRFKDSCVVEREWVMVTPFQDCSHRSLRRARPVLKFIYVF